MHEHAHEATKRSAAGQMGSVGGAAALKEGRGWCCCRSRRQARAQLLVARGWWERRMCEQPESLSCCVATVHAVCLGGGTDGHPVYSSRCVGAKRRGMSMVFWRARVHEEPQSLGCCGLITRAVCLDADTALSHGLSPCELVALCRG